MAIQFNASGEYVRRDCTGDTIGTVTYADDWTMAAWVRLDTDLNTYGFIFGPHNVTDGSGNSAQLGVNSDGVSLYADTAVGGSGQDTGTDLSVAEWIYVVYQYDSDLGFRGGYSRAADPGITWSTRGTSAQNAPANFITVGAGPEVTFPFEGTVAHFRVWKEEMSDANLLTEKGKTTLQRTTNAYLAWEFVSDATDSFGSRHGTANGTVSYVTGPDLGTSTAALAVHHLTMLHGNS